MVLSLEEEAKLLLGEPQICSKLTLVLDTLARDFPEHVFLVLILSLERALGLHRCTGKVSSVSGGVLRRLWWLLCTDCNQLRAAFVATLRWLLLSSGLRTRPLELELLVVGGHLFVQLSQQSHWHMALVVFDVLFLAFDRENVIRVQKLRGNALKHRVLSV